MARMLRGLRPVEFQHPMDRMYLARFRDTPRIAEEVRSALAAMVRDVEPELREEAVAAREDNYPVLLATYRKVAAVLDVANPPPLYVCRFECPNACIAGSETAAVLLVDVRIAEDFGPAELAFVLGHELGHHLCGHSVYQEVARQRITTVSLELREWDRYSELSADRAGLLAAQSFEDVCSAMLRIAAPTSTQPLEIPASAAESAWEVLVKGHIDEQDGLSVLEHVRRQLEYICTEDHPLDVERYVALRDWRDDGSYDELTGYRPEEHARLSGIIEKESEFRRGLVGVLISETCAYLDAAGIIARKDSLPLVRRAYRFGVSQLEEGLSCLLRSELAVARDAGKMDYSLVLYLLSESRASHGRKVTIPVVFDDAWESVDQEIREKIIRSASRSATILIYQA